MSKKATKSKKKTTTKSSSSVAKKRTSESVSKTSKPISRVSRHKDLYDEDFTITKQQQFTFNEFDSTDDIDTSFIEVRKKKSPSKPIQVAPTPIKKLSNHYRFLFFVLLFLLFVASGMGIYHYATFNHQKEKIVTKIKKVVDNNYLFLGDSITEWYDLKKFYPDMPVVNSGFNAHTTEHILKDMEKRIYQYNPSKIFLLIGTNDLIKDKSNDDIVKNIGKIISGIQKNRPYSEIYLESILPVNRDDDDKIDLDMVNNKRSNKRIREINEKLKVLAKEKKVTYIDLYDELDDDNGSLDINYTKEGLHLSDEGYQKVTDVLTKYIKEEVKDAK